MKAVVIGAGRIGCGFVGQLLRASGYEVIFVARNPLVEQHINRFGCYQIRLVWGCSVNEILVDGVRAIPVTQPDQVIETLAAADLVATAVGAHNLPHVAALLAAGLAQRRTPVNILAFENLDDAGSRLQRLVERALPQPIAVEHGFGSALVSRVVTQRLTDPEGNAPLVLVGDPPSTCVAEGAHLCQPLPHIEGMMVADNYRAWIQRKLYTYSAGHATTAYLGYLKGYRYIHSAIRDPEIRMAVLAAMAEGQQGLAARYGPEIAGDEHDLQAIIARFENAALADPIVRVGRDPCRKLGATDRLVGAAHLAQEAGVQPYQLALGAAAALCFYHPTDPSAAALQQMLQTIGLGQVLQRISGLDVRRGLGRLVADGWCELGRGWRQGNVLLSLERRLWAWS